jgi:hypothetical protein
MTPASDFHAFGVLADVASLGNVENFLHRWAKPGLKY